MRSGMAGLLLAALVVAGLGYWGWQSVRARESESCGACRRPVHDDTVTAAIFQGKRVRYCCPACAAWQSRQTGGSVKVLNFTDYRTGGSIRPEGAFLVRGSDVAPCARHLPAAGLDKQPFAALFDRCSPSLIAFGGKASAEAFAAEHGGRVVSFADVGWLR